MPLTTRRSTAARSGRSSWLGLVASVALLAGLLVPTSTANADITFGKPTSVDAKSISGSNGLKATWKAPTGGTPAAYKVTWGKSSSASKASYATYTTGTSATLSATGMDTKTYYYVWVQPWSTAGSSGEATGALSSYDKVKTSSFAYKAPAVIKVANMTKTTAEITWRTVTGSPGYVIRAYNYTTGSYKYQIGFDGSTIFTGLAPGTKYKFTVANRLLITGYETVPGVRMSGFSSAYTTGTTNPASVTLADGSTSAMLDAPTALTTTDRDSSSVTLTWTPPDGYNAATDQFRVYWAENQEMTDNDGYTATGLSGTSGKVTGLDSNTNYYLRIRMIRVTSGSDGVPKTTAISDRSTAIMAKTRSPKGFIAGNLTGAAGNVLTDYQAVAFARTSANSPGEINAVTDVSAAGAYKLEVRPGTYYVKFAYVGAGNYAPQWLTTDGSAAYASQDGGTVVAKLDTTTTAESVAIGIGASLTGKVTSSTTGNPIRDVYVSARTAWGTTKEVVSQATTDKDGNYTLVGLPPNQTVWVRVADSARKHTTKTVSPAASTPAAGGSTTLNISMAPS